MVTFNEAMLSNDRTLAIRVGDFTSENIKSANFKYGYITGDDFTPGGTYAGTASITFTSIVETFNKLDIVYPEIGVLVGSKFEWVKMGKYYIDDIKLDRSANTTEIELMDDMFKLNEPYKTDLTYPAQIRDVIREIATKTGTTLASDDFGTTAIQQHVIKPTGDKLTFRDVLSQASQLLGFSCFFNREGKLEVRGLTESGITITADNYFLHGLEKSEVEYQIAGITCEVTDDEKLTVGLQTGRSLEIENPLATQDTLNLLYYALKDIVYYPYDLSYQGHLKLDVGQWVTIKTNKDETFKVPVLYQSFSFSGGLTSTISADSVAGSDAQYTYGSFVTKKIEQKSTRIQAEVQQQLKYADEKFDEYRQKMTGETLAYQAEVKQQLATSKAELETQIDTAKTQAESNAKAYADEINQATSEVAEQANKTADTLKSELAKVKSDLTATETTANAAKTSASEAKQQLTTVANDLNTAKQDLQTQASQLTAQANAQSELTKRVSSVEETASGTKTTVSELSKTVAQNGKDITSVTARTKTVEDDLAGTKTTLSQVQTTANSASQKTATLETGLNGLSAKFESLKIGSRNYFKNSKSRKYYINDIETQDVRTYIDDDFWKNDTRFTKGYVRMSFDIAFNPALPSNFTTNVHFSASPWYNCGGITFKGGTTDLQHFDLKFDLSGAGKTYKTDNVFIRLNNTLPLNTAVSLENFNLYLSAVVEDYSQNEADIESKVAEYKQTADQNYASLQSNLQTLDGTVNQNKSEFDQTASQLKTSISAVEGKIPTSVGGRNLWIQSKATGDFVEETLPDNHITGQKKCYRISPNQKIEFNISPDFSAKLCKKITFSAWIKYENVVQGPKSWNKFEVFKHTLYRKNSSTGATSSADFKVLAELVGTSDWKYVTYTYDYSDNKSYDQIKTNLRFILESVSSGTAWITAIKVEEGAIPTAWSLAPEDYDSDITKLSSEIKQTADGMTLLATKTELSTAKSDLQSGITTATNKANAAQSTADNNAKTISTHTTQISALNTGLSAKVSQTDFNTLSGRVTTAENNITAKANELSSKISSLTIGNRNYLPTSRVINRGSTNFKYNESSKSWTMTIPASSTTFGNGIAFNTNGLNILLNGGETLFFGLMIKANKACSFNYDINNALSGSTSNDNDDRAKQAWGPSNKSIPANVWTRVWFSYTAKANVPITEANSNFGIVNNKEAINIEIKEVMVAKSNVPVDYQTPDADFEAKDTEFKQTAESIKASVSVLDKSTVKSANLTINTDGIVMKAGKSTTDIANAIGSYFSVNQNAINLFSDKINVKGSMIVDGAITSAKIASKSINTAHLNGKIITADVIATNAITADAIKAGAVTTDKMTANSINGDRITAGTLDAAKIKAGSITASQIASGTITSSQIKSGTIVGTNIAAGAITTNHLAAGSITADKIAANAIDVSKLTGNVASFVTNAINNSDTSVLSITASDIKILKKSNIGGGSTRIGANSIWLFPPKLNNTSGANGAGIMGIQDKLISNRVNTLIDYLEVGPTISSGDTSKNLSSTFDGKLFDYAGNGLRFSNRSHINDSGDNDVSIMIDEYNTSSLKYAYMTATSRKVSVPGDSYRIQFNTDGTIDLRVRNIYYTGSITKK